jgi:hypothetical protein
MGGLEQVFALYDTIRSDHAPDKPMGHEDAPPWQPMQAEVVANSQQPVDEVASPAPSDRAQLDSLGYKNFRSWGDVRADKEEKAARLIEERLNTIQPQEPNM